MANVQLIECPRDAMQGWRSPISTTTKIHYLNALLDVGFHSLDFGSFVSPKAIPQMADTAQVLDALEWKNSATGLLAIVANQRGAEEAILKEGVRYLGFPLSVSPTFQLRNTQADLTEAMNRVRQIQTLCQLASKELVVYLSMAFGNPYGDDYSVDQVTDMAGECHAMGIQIISLADTVGLAEPDEVYQLSVNTRKFLPSCTIGVHLHSAPRAWKAKIEAAWSGGIRRFDTALGGFGGCPMAGDILVGNMDTQWLLTFLDEKGIETGLDRHALEKCQALADEIFKH